MFVTVVHPPAPVSALTDCVRLRMLLPVATSLWFVAICTKSLVFFCARS